MSTPQQIPEQDQDVRAVKALALAVVTLIVVQILAQGYLPTDDSLRHAAKAVSGRPWQELLVTRPDVVDFSPGWHAFLGAVHALTGANAHTLVWIEIITTFVLFSLGPILLMRRPEAWLLTLTVGAALEPQLVQRLIIGRPLVLSMAILVAMCLTWRRLDTERLSRPAFAAATVMVAAATWIHGSWYLWILPVIACALAGRRRVAVRLFAATCAGVLLGAVLSGHPVAFLWQNAALGFQLRASVSAFVYEMQPYPFFAMLTLAVPALLVARKVWLGVPAREALSNPVLVLAAMGWLLGFKSARFWMDWGTPALLVFSAVEIEALWLALVERRRRFLTAGAIALAGFLVWTANLGDRWRSRHEPAFRDMLTPRRAGALPDSGGVLYTDDRRIFYEMSYLHPTAPWRYALGFAPELMLDEDYAVYFDRHVGGTIESLEPWARKMRPEDRLLIRDPRGIPLWDWMEWQQLEGGFYSGRRKR